jgi:hypothetical protein
MSSRFAILVTTLLAALAIVIAVSETLTFRVAGFRPLARLEARDLLAPEAIEDLAAARFLEERNHLEVEILRDMTLRDFVRLYQLAEQPHIRRQIVAQDGAPTLPDSHVLKKGKRASGGRAGGVRRPGWGCPVCSQSVHEASRIRGKEPLALGVAGPRSAGKTLFTLNLIQQLRRRTVRGEPIGLMGLDTTEERFAAFAGRLQQGEKPDAGISPRLAMVISSPQTIFRSLSPPWPIFMKCCLSSLSLTFSCLCARMASHPHKAMARNSPLQDPASNCRL